MEKVISETRRPVKVWASQLEEQALEQAKNVANMPFIHSHVALMPDAHWGMGATVGSVIATKGAIIPAAVGVDIGCGMCAVQLPFKIDQIEDVPKLRSSIERSVPVGFNQHKEITDRMDRTLNISKYHQPSTEFNTKELNKLSHQLGTLGGGNHFIEICHDKDNQAWVMLHSGSRGIGNLLARKHIEKAKGLMKSYFIDLPDPNLAYFVQGTNEFQDYLSDLLWAQDYAKQNRNEMMLRVLKDISYHIYGEDIGFEKMTKFRVDCHHNYTSQENHFGKNVWLTRKGAVSARKDEWGIIPGSMGVKSYIVQGLGNPDSFCSCSHGAGRAMSRTQAKKQFTQEDLKAQTEGVECRKDKDVIDEIPGAYKDIDQVMADQKDLVKPVFELKQILCVKG